MIPFRLLQMIQQRLQQVEVKQRELEDRGVMVEKALRGEAGEPGRRTHLNTHLGLNKTQSKPDQNQELLPELT